MYFFYGITTISILDIIFVINIFSLSLASCSLEIYVSYIREGFMLLLICLLLDTWNVGRKGFDKHTHTANLLKSLSIPLQILRI